MLVRTRNALALTLTAAVLTGCTPAREDRKIPVPPTKPESVVSLQKVASQCGLQGADGVKLEAAGTSLTIDTKGTRETSGAAVEDVRCVLINLGVPESIQSQMTLTTSEEGPREANFAGRRYSWDYDPSTWFRLTITES